ncbi:hypothetical protein ACHAWF_005365 [Thalassiosira exigua]
MQIKRRRTRLGGAFPAVPGPRVLRAALLVVGAACPVALIRLFPRDAGVADVHGIGRRRRDAVAAAAIDGGVPPRRRPHPGRIRALVDNRRLGNDGKGGRTERGAGDGDAAAGPTARAALDAKRVQSQSIPSNGTATGKHPPGARIDDANGEKNWKWYGGDLNEYYNKLERDEHAKRDPNDISSYAVHRWMGPERSTLIHYQLVRESIYELVLGREAPSSEAASKATSGASEKLRVFDAGCGLGPGLMWIERHEPEWGLVGHTISEVQFKWIAEDLPPHDFVARLRTYDEPLLDGDEGLFDAIYSIEAAIHSPDLRHTLRSWSDALRPGGIVVLVDDFLSAGVPRDDPDVDLFARSWIAAAVHATDEISSWADRTGLTLVRDRDLGREFEIVKRNYRNKTPALRDERGRVHQGWLGSKVRQKLMVEGKITYRLVVLQKKIAAEEGDTTK